jgi:outer membrane protein OmpA-like peptidoglycan-associated protein
MRVMDYHFGYFRSILNIVNSYFATCRGYKLRKAKSNSIAFGHKKNTQALVVGILICLLMSGCENRVQGVYPLPNYYANGVAFGAPPGALVPTFMHLGLTAANSAVIFAAVGVAIGSAQDAKNLSERGVQVFQVGDEITIIMPSDKFFRADSPGFRYESFPAMESLAKFIKAYPDSAIRVCGFADNVSGYHYSRYVSRIQAQSVMAYLWTHAGIPWEHMRVIAAGSEDPIATNLTVRGKGQNRHIEIRLRRGYFAPMGPS